MKKHKTLTVAATFAVLWLAGCPAKNPNAPVPQNEYLLGNLYPDAVQTEQAQIPSGSGSFKTLDVDLTKFNANMVYSTVFDMMIEPEQFAGKVIKLNGTCVKFHDDGDNADYYACLVQDATACCANGLEFVLADGNYPAENTAITVVGIFDQFQINGYDSFHLVQAEVL